MKRTSFKRKMKPMGDFGKSPELKKRPVKRAKPKIEKGLKKELWELCKQITRKRHGNVCYTCGKKDLTGSSWQTGHFIPSSVGGFSLRYNLDNLRPQCYYCNINLGGNGSAFYKHLVELEGQEYVNNLFKLKEVIIKGDWVWLQSKVDEYTKIACVLNA